MKRWLFVLMLVSCGARAEKPVEINVTTNAKCSPAVGINYGNVTVNCNDPKLEEKLRSLPDLVNYNLNMEKLAKLNIEVGAYRKELQDLKNNSRVTAKDKDSLRDKLRDTDEQLSNLRRENQALSSQLADTLAKLPEFVQGVVDAAVARAFDQQFQKSSQLLYDNINQALTSYQNKLDTLTVRVDDLENNQAFFMKEFLAGRLKENVGFFGLSIGGDYLASAWQPRVGIEYEVLLPTIHDLFDQGGSVFVELARINWKETRDYPTLPGLDPIKIQDKNNLTLFSIGGRLFIQEWSDELQSYVGASFGRSFAGKENAFSSSLAVGTEYFRQSTRVAFEIRLDRFSNIERTEKTFKPFGNASAKIINEARNGWYAGIRVAF